MTRLLILFFFTLIKLPAQTLNLNNQYFEKNLRISQLNGDIDSLISFTVRPIHIDMFDFKKEIFDKEIYSPTVLSFMNGKGKVKVLPIV